MGRIGKILSFFRTTKRGSQASQVKINQSGGNNITCEHFEDAGSDSFPLNTDYPVIMDIDRSGGLVVVGYLDPLTEKKAQIGEKRIYARDLSGQSICEVWLRNDKTIEISNEMGLFKLMANGDFIINGAKITKDGDIISSSGVSLNNHYHSQGNDSNGNTEQDTSTSIATE